MNERSQDRFKYLGNRRNSDGSIIFNRRLETFTFENGGNNNNIINSNRKPTEPDTRRYPAMAAWLID